MRRIKRNPIQSKSILTKSALPGDDFCINPYSGCTFGCSYCYADFMRRFTGHGKDKWGEYVDVKVNAAGVLEKELQKLSKRQKTEGKRQDLSIVIGSVCDPYQPVEAKYRITRKCLKVISKFNNLPLDIAILTKSHFVTRDIDVIKKIRNISVGLTITSTDDKVARLLEGNAPPANLRLKALAKLQKEGISTYVCVNPLLPHFVANEKKLRKLFDAIVKTGNREIWLEHINLSGNKLKRIKQAILHSGSTTDSGANSGNNVIKYFEKANSEKYKSSLNKLLFRILKDYDFEIGGGGIIDHRRKTIIVSGNKKLKRLKHGWYVETIC